MNPANQILASMIGDMVLQLASAQAQIQLLTAELAKFQQEAAEKEGAE